MKNRKQAKQKFYGKTTMAYSHQYQSAAVLESELEADFFNWVNFEGCYDHFEMQPDSIFYYHNNKRLRYTADALLTITSQKSQHIYIEIKYKREAEKPELIEKFKRLKKYFNENGCIFVVLTEEDIRVGERANNLNYLHPALAYSAPVEELNDLLSHTTKKTMSHDEFVTLQTKCNAKSCLLRRAVAHRLLLCDLTLPFEKLILSLSSDIKPTTPLFIQLQKSL